MLKYIKLSADHLELIMGWRMQPHVTKYMLTDIDDNINKQRNWYENIDTNQSKYWMISYENQFVGLVYLTDIDPKNYHCKLGFYIGEKEYTGIGGLCLPPVYNYIFNKMKFVKIYGEVIEGNELIMKIHKHHGWRKVGIFKDHIFKNNVFIDVHIVELLKHHWLSNKDRKSVTNNIYFEE